MSRIAHQMRPSNFKVFQVVFKRHCLLSIKNINELIYPIFYFLISIVAFKIAIGAKDIPFEVSVGIIFVINIFVLILTNDALLIKDYKLGFLEQFYLIGSEFSLILLAKYLAHFMIYMFISIGVIPIILFLSNIAFKYWFITLASQLLLSAIVLLFLMLSSSMLLGSKAKMLLSIIVLIFAFPSIILATLGIHNSGYLLLLIALLLFFLPIITLSCKYLVLLALEDKA